MSVEKVRAYLEPYGVTDRIREFDVSSATVELAALAVGVEGARIAKTLSFKVGEDPILIVAAGDAKVDNHKYKDTFHTKTKMIPYDEVEHWVGHAPGGVCPFGINEGVEVWRLCCPLLRVLHVKLKRVLQHRRSSRLALHLRCVDDLS